jgi:phage-related baseplate assembly protein
MSAVDLTLLPPPDVIEALSFEAIVATIKADLVERLPAIAATIELESEPATKLIEAFAYRELTLRARINDAARACLLAYAQGADLDQLAANYNQQRFAIEPGNPAAIPPVAPTYEADDELRARVQLAFEGLSVAGPTQAYEFHARSADPRVADVSATSPLPCEALITVLSRDGDGTAVADLLLAVEAALNAETIRPVGDRVTVQSAEIVPYAVEAVIHCYPGPETEPILAAAQAQLAAYISAHRRIGRDIRRSAIYAALHVEGVQRVELAAPAADVVISLEQAASCTASTVTLGGADE